MTKKIFYTLVFAVLLVSCASARPQRDTEVKEYFSKDIDLEMHNELKQRWVDSGIDSYTMEINYNLFSPHKGKWIIEVQNGFLTGWERENRKNDDTDKHQAQFFLQENLYTLAAEAYINDGPYIVDVAYNNDGFITLINKKPDRNKQSDRPANRGFRIAITDIHYIME